MKNEIGLSEHKPRRLGCRAFWQPNINLIYSCPTPSGMMTSLPHVAGNTPCRMYRCMLLYAQSAGRLTYLCLTGL